MNPFPAIETFGRLPIGNARAGRRACVKTNVVVKDPVAPQCDVGGVGDHDAFVLRVLDGETRDHHASQSCIVQPIHVDAGWLIPGVDDGIAGVRPNQG